MNSTRTWLILRGLVCAICFAAGGCGASPEPAEIDRGLVFVDPPQDVIDANRAALDQSSVRWLVRRLLVRLDHPLEPVWTLADETVLPEISRAVWNGNGLRVGRLDASKYLEFAQTIGQTVNTDDMQLLITKYAEVLRRSPPLAAEFLADLTVPPAAVRIESFTKGHLQMLMEAADRGNGQIEVVLTPQHHRPRASLLPRGSHEKILDGRVFDELSVSFQIGMDHTLLLGLYLPPPPAELTRPDEAANLDADAANSNQPKLGPQKRNHPDEFVFEQAKQSADPTLNLGRGLFTTGLKDHSLQILYLLRPLPVN